VVLATTGAAAQQVTGDIQGRILGPGGQPLVEVQVTALGPSLQGDRRALSDTRGRFVLPSLPAGSYSVAIQRIGYGSVHFQDVPVRLGSTTSLGDVRLEAQAVEVAGVVVSGAKPVIDPVSPATGATLDSSQFLSLPSDRNFRSLMAYVPQANASFYGDGVNVGGSTGLENAFFVDGMDVTVGNGTSVDLPFNFVREIQVATGGYEAEFGRALSGVVNVVTPSGGNEFHGQVLGFFTGDELRTTPKVGTHERDVTTFSRYDLGVSLSGPIRRDRLWYSGAYNPSFARQRESVGALPDQQDVEVHHLFAGKLTWRSRSGTDVALTFLGDPSHRNGVETAILPLTTDLGTAISRSSTGTETVGLALRHELDHGAELRFAVSRLWRRDDFFPRSGATDLTDILRLDDYTTNASSGGPGGYSSFRETRTALRTNVTVWRAAHTIKIGAEYEANAYAGIVHGSLLIRISDTLYDWSEAYLLSHVQNRVPTFYAQDAWEVTRRLRLSAGLRWESQHMTGRVGPPRTVPMELAPRLGVVFQVGEPGAARLFASAGRFYEQVPPLSEIWWNGKGFYLERAFPKYPLVDSSNGVVLQRLDVPIDASPDLLGQAYDQFGIGFERRLGRKYKVGVRGTYRILRWVIEDGFAPGDPLDRMGNPGRGLLATMPRARQRYAALEVSVERATPGPLYLLASYVLSRNVGNYTGLNATDMNFPQPNSGSTYDVPDAMTDAYGLLPNDRTHVFKAAASYHFGAATLGGFLTIASGTPLSEGGSSAYGAAYWTFIRPRGSAGRTPTIWSLDLHGAYDLPIAQGLSVRPRVLIDVFNVGSPRRPVLFDQRHYTSPDRADVNPNYRAVTSYQPPMSARVGLVVDF
jgi:hypothetical protein